MKELVFDGSGRETTRSFAVRRWGTRGAAAFYLALFVAATAIFIFGEPPEVTVFWDAVFDIGHMLLFGFLMWLALSVQELRRGEDNPGGWRDWQAFAVTLAVGAGSEMLQWFQPTRDPSIGDFLRDTAGASSVLLLRLARLPRRPTVRFAVPPWALRVVVAGLVLAVLTPLALVLRDYRDRDRAFPTVLRLDNSSWERRFLTVRDAVLVPASAPAAPGEPLASSAATIALRPGPFSGVFLSEPYPDWRGYRWLVSAVTSQAESPVTLTVRVQDIHYKGGNSDRFSENIVLEGGRQPIRVAIADILKGLPTREMDLSRIRGVAIFVWRLDRPIELRLEPLRLE